jgi:UDP-N-acetylmuramoyl-tripeptide--D-alanyl-D-alanine ligase
MKQAPLWKISEVVAATGGLCDGEADIFGLSIDTRQITKGDMFIALSDKRDGHTFLENALASGAAAFLVEDGNPHLDAFAAQHPDANLIRVRRVMTALYDLARAARMRSTARVIAVTGSAGKTGVKESLRSGLAHSGKTHAAEKSFNNHIGVPLTLARLPADADFAVFEIGMSAAGEIEPLSRLVQPEIAIITTISAAHIEALGSLEAIARAKAEIFKGMPAGGAAILPTDNEQFNVLEDQALAHNLTIIPFGRTADLAARSGAYVLKSRAHADCSCIQADILGQSMTYKIAQAGDHQIINSLAVLAAVSLAGADLALAGLELAQVEAIAGRGQRHVLALPNGSRFTLVDESYNANPASMQAALLTLAAMPVEKGGRRIAVLGDMAELGAMSEALHRDLADVINEQNIDLAFTSGRFMQVLHNSIAPAKQAGHVTKPYDLIPLLEREIRTHDVVMVKGSNASKMGLIVDHFSAFPSLPQARQVGG